jgi:hypothetical protein
MTTVTGELEIKNNAVGNKFSLIKFLFFTHIPHTATVIKNERMNARIMDA